MINNIFTEAAGIKFRLTRLVPIMRIAVLLVCVFLSSILLSQDTGKISLFDKLYKASDLSITLTYPFDSLVKTNNEEIDAYVTIISKEGVIVKDAPMAINIRGKFRRMKCSMPPLLLNFKKSTLKELNLLSYDEIKLVTHCIDGPEGQHNLQEERLVYQLYETFTPLAYRSIWLTVEYCNSLKKGECYKSTGFLLEPDKVISDRLGVKEMKMYNMAEDSIDYNSYSHTAAFNFLIGNRDWSIISSRNAKLFYNPAMRQYVVIPYDFDYANIVGASYRRETIHKSMSHPFDRIYEGEYFKDRAGEILKTFYQFEKPILDAVNTARNPMDTQRREKICKYFESWFSMVKKSKADKLKYGSVCPYNGSL